MKRLTRDTIRTWALALVSCLSSFVLRADIPTLADFGIMITNCVRDTRGILVDFVTAQPAPYFAGVYPVYDWQEGGYISEVAGTHNSLYIPGDFTDMPVWVKVITSGRIAEVNTPGFEDFHRKLTKAEVASYAAVCGKSPGPDFHDDVRWKSWFGQTGPLIYTGAMTVYRYWSVGYDGIVYTNTASATSTKINFSPRWLPSAVAGEEGIRYWPAESYSGTNYNPAANNSWCIWSTNDVPLYLMYKDGPTFELGYNCVSNVTPEEYAAMDEAGTGGVVIVKQSLGTTPPLTLVRGQVLSRSNINMPTLSIGIAPDYGFAQVTNRTQFFEFSHGWALRPLHLPALRPLDQDPHEEILWHDVNHRTNTSNAVYLPRLFRGIPNNGPSRATTDFYGRAIVVTNTPSHWEADFGVTNAPPSSNSFWRIHHE